MARFEVTVLCESLKTLRGESLSFRVVRTVDAPDALIAGERALSVVRADRELKDSRYDPWHPPALEVQEIREVAEDSPVVRSDFEWR